MWFLISVCNGSWDCWQRRLHPSIDFQFLNRSDPRRHGQWCMLALAFFQVAPKVRSWDHLCFFSRWTNYHLYSTPPQPVGFCWRLFDLSFHQISFGPCGPAENLESFHRWGDTWGLKFNVSKCNIMHLSRKSVLPTRFYTLGWEVITSVSESKYLGVTFSNNYGTRSSQWKSHISQSASQANQHLTFLRRNLGGSPYKLRELAYISLVRPTMEYCGAIWDTTVKEECDRLEIVERWVARWARGAKGII